MLRYAVAIVVLLLTACPASAQFSSSEAMGSPGLHSSGGGYAGPGDVASAFVAFWSSTRAYNFSKRGAAIINVCNSTGGVDVGCADMTTDLLTGVLTPATISGISCPGASCTVRTFYDQVGSNNCTQNTIANRGTLTANAFGTRTGMTGTTTSVYSCTAIAQATPWSFYSVSNQPSGGSGFYVVNQQENGSSFIGQAVSQSASFFWFDQTSSFAVGVTLPNSYVWIGIDPASGSGSQIINGTQTNGGVTNGALTTSGFTMHNWRNNPGIYGEGGVYNGNLLTLFRSTPLTNNARSFYGF
jgi:hypothetical protein